MNNYLIELNELGIVIDWLEASKLNIQFSKLAVIGHGVEEEELHYLDQLKISVLKYHYMGIAYDFKARFPVDVSEWKETEFIIY